MSHYGYLRTISAFEDLGKHLDDMQRHLDMLNGDGSWMGVSLMDSILRAFTDSFPRTDTFPGSNSGRYQSSRGKPNQPGVIS